MKRHSHYCPVARSLDLLGDRWTILIIRELGFGDARFSTLRRNLPGISPTLLTERLQTLVAHGLVTTRTASAVRGAATTGTKVRAAVKRTRAPRVPSTARADYTLTAKGRDALPIVRAMARFGMSLLSSPRRAAKIRPQVAAYGALLAYYDPHAAADIDERYRLVIDGETFELASARGVAPTTSAHGEPDLIVTGPAQAVIAARRGEISFDDAVASGALDVRGSKRARRHFQRVFHLS